MSDDNRPKPKRDSVSMVGPYARIRVIVALIVVLVALIVIALRGLGL